MIEARIDSTFASWRIAARKLLRANIDPADVIWTDIASGALPSLARSLDSISENIVTAVTVPKEFLPLAETVSFHRDPGRWILLYRLLYRLAHGQPRLLQIAVDDDVYRLREMEKSVRRDLHKMHAFVRFRRIENDDGELYVAFHRPDHLIMRAAAPWFARRFAVMRWTIFTPDSSASWDGHALQFGPGVAASAMPEDDGLEELWRTYYANIFNPARIKISAMKKEMPMRHWPTLPETQIIDDLLRDAPARVEEMMAKVIPNAVGASQFVPKNRQLSVLREAATSCKGCDLHCNATQTVFGEGPAHAIAMFVGEQPGDQEDRAGHPFVGPAGQLLDEALEAAGIDRKLCYVTNAVKHFKFEQRGTRRIHSKPNAREMSACKPWLLAEIETVKPNMIIALGATAAQTMTGPQFRITRSRGEIFTDTQLAPWFMATLHPSALLRIPDPVLREQSHRQFIGDLTTAAAEIRLQLAKKSASFKSDE
jgi:probable DNA metabolism protein